MSAREFAANPYRFMETNLVITPDNPPAAELLAPAPVVSISVVKFTGTVELDAPKRGDVAGGVYSLVFGDHEHAIRAYWCPYEENSKGRSIMLGNDANYMFTVTMNLCTFGIGLGVGTNADGGFVRVAHANQGSAAAGNTVEELIATQSQAQTRGLEGLGVADRLISPADYVNDAQGQFARRRKATTFGMHRIGKAWAFFMLKYELKSAGAVPTYRHYGVSHMAGGGWGSW
jgi:hypothetical protein